MGKNVRATICSQDELAPHCFRLVLSGAFEDFAIQPGQFVMLKVGEGLDPLLRRPFAASPRKEGVAVLLEIYYLVVGRGTEILSHLMPGTAVEVLGPLGKGFRCEPDADPVLIVAGGIGIAPLRGLVHQAAHSSAGHLHLFWGAKSAASLLFHAELARLPLSLHLATEDGSLGYPGLVTEVFARFVTAFGSAAGPRAQCFTCGPLPMVRAVAAVCQEHQVPCQVSLEARMACGIGVCLGCAVKVRPTNLSPAGEYRRVCVEGPVFGAEEIAW
jgi:dihydroorotate dehydrogenase electron transfer subunit